MRWAQVAQSRAAQRPKPRADFEGSARKLAIYKANPGFAGVFVRSAISYHPGRRRTIRSGALTALELLGWLIETPCPAPGACNACTCGSFRGPWFAARCPSRGKQKMPAAAEMNQSHFSISFVPVGFGIPRFFVVAFPPELTSAQRPDQKSAAFGMNDGL
jgi:hypothetical protein